MPTPRIKNLDKLRGLAILLVLIFHTEEKGLNSSLFLKIKNVGWVGVDIFFVLSGYLISKIIFNESSSFSLKRFYLRRALRIHPPFYLMVIFSLITIHFLGINIDRIKILSETFFLQSYLPTIWPHTWSLSVEEIFYVSLPFFIYLFKKNIELGCFVIIILCLASRLFENLILSEYLLSKSHHFAHNRLDTIFIGVLIGYYFEKKKIEVLNFCRNKYLYRLSYFLLFLTPLLIDFQTNNPISALGYCAVYLYCSNIVVYNLLNDKIKLNILDKTFEYLGVHSYSIYLWHFPVKYIFVPSIVISLGLESGFYSIIVITYFVLSLIVGITLSIFIEKPLMRLRDMLVP